MGGGSCVKSADNADGEDGGGNHRGHRGAQSTESGRRSGKMRMGMGTGRAPEGSAVVVGKWEWGARQGRLSSTHFQRQHARRVSPRPLQDFRSSGLGTGLRQTIYAICAICGCLLSAHLRVPLCASVVVSSSPCLRGSVVNLLEKGEIAKQSHFERIRRLRRWAQM